MIECGLVAYPDPRCVPVDREEATVLHTLVRAAALGNRQPSFERHVRNLYGAREQARREWTDAS